MLPPSKVSLVDVGNDNQPITHLEWSQYTNQLADFFRDGLRIRKGHQMPTYAMNRVECPDALLASGKLGAISHYRCVAASLINTVVSWGLRPDDVTPQQMPFFRPGGLNVLTMSMVYMGSPNDVCASLDKVRKSVMFVDAFPKTAACKVDKQELIEHYGP